MPKQAPNITQSPAAAFYQRLCEQASVALIATDREFRVVFWITVVLNCGGLVWLHTAAGQAQLEQLLASIV